jgi:hypothetical protein
VIACAPAAKLVVENVETPLLRTDPVPSETLFVVS